MLLFNTFFWLSMFSLVTSLSLSEVLVIFGDKNCISGSLHSLLEKNVDLNKEMVRTADEVNNVSSENEEKSAMSYINELAQYNDISYSYELIDQEGQPHDRLFTVTLYLGDEHYTSAMKSIKKAQQSAASTALKSTKYQHPPVKIKENEKSLTPTVLLNNLAAKLGLSVTYTVITNELKEELEKQSEVEFVPKKSYLQKLNETVHSNDTIHVRKDSDDLKGPFKVRVDVNGVKFVGKAHSIKNARHEAAAKALKSLRENESAFQCLKEDDNCKSKKQNIKSPISLAHEAAQKRNLPITFEVIDEVGPSHKKIFTTKCVVGELEATGEGKSKKDSKRAAAENVLPQLLAIPESKDRSRSTVLTSKKSKKKNKVIKSTFDKIDRMFDNFVDFGKGLVDTMIGNKESSSTDNSKPKKNKDRKLNRSPTDELFQLGNILNLQIQFQDFSEKNKYYSVVDLGTKPSFICLGEGVNEKNSRDLASKYGINNLYKLGFLDGLLDKTMDISNALDKEETYQHFILEVIESEDEKKM